MKLDQLWRARVPLLLLVAMLAFLVGAYEYDDAARALPSLVAWTTVGLLILEILVQAGTAVGRRIEASLGGRDLLPTPEAVPMAKALIHAVVWPSLLVGLTIVIGILPAVLAYIGLSLKIVGGKTLLRSFATAVIVTILAWVLFEWGLSYQLYRGMLIDMYARLYVAG